MFNGGKVESEEKSEDSVLVVYVLLMCFGIFLLFIYLWDFYFANYYENLKPKNIEYISFYRYTDNPKEKLLLLKIDKPKDIEYFWANYWGELSSATFNSRASGHKFIISIKTTDKLYEFIATVSANDPILFVNLHLIDDEHENVKINTTIKSYNLNSQFNHSLRVKSSRKASFSISKSSSISFCFFVKGSSK